MYRRDFPVVTVDHEWINDLARLMCEKLCKGGEPIQIGIEEEGKALSLFSYFLKVAAVLLKETARVNYDYADLEDIADRIREVSLDAKRYRNLLFELNRDATRRNVTQCP